MNHSTTCPLCDSQIPEARIASGLAICQCGWYDDRSDRQARLLAERKTITIMIMSSLLMAALYAHAVTWGSHAISIPVMKIQKLIGTLSSQGHEELAQACIDLGKYSCAADAYLNQFQARGDVRGLAHLGKLKMRLGQSEAAMAAFAQYMKSSSGDVESAYLYGKLLEASGRHDEALAAYQTATALSTERLPVLSTGAIVRLMIKLGRFEEAYARLLEFHDSTEQAKGYLNSELSQLETQLGMQSKTENEKASAPSRKKLSPAGKRVARL